MICSKELLSRMVFILIFTIGLIKPIVAQERTVSGKVTDKHERPLPGVTVVLKGTTTGIVTNMDGNYSLTGINNNSILTFSFIGMKSQEIIVANQAIINVTLLEDIIGLEEVVAIGYGTVRKSDLTGSVERVSAADIETKSITNMVEALAGTVAGFYSQQGTTAAGGGTMEVRGPTSLAANISPLVVLDGVIFNGNLRDINPSDIESIDILKDASAAAIFGSRSASGVIVVTTKKGTISKPTINLSVKTGVTGLTKHMNPLSPMDYLRTRGDFFRRIHSDSRPLHYYTHPDELPNNITLQEWAAYDAGSSSDYVGLWLSRLVVSPKERANFLAGRTTDWYDEIVRNGIRQDYDVSVTGGQNNFRYFFSSGYVHNEGVTIGDEFKSFRSRINIDADIYDFLTVGVNSQFGDRDQGFERISIEDAVRQSPWTQIYDEDGNLIMYPNDDTLVQNPFNYYNYRQRYNKIQSVFATLYAQLNLPYGFSFRINYSNNFYFVKDYLYDPIQTPRGQSNAGYGYRTNNSNYDWMVDNILKWNKTFADIHRFDLTLLYNAEKNQSWWDQQINSKMQPSGALGFHGLQAGTNPQLSNNDVYSTGNALMARLNYVLLNRYLLTVAWRRDGYSAFGQANPYAQFPSGALAWTISEEEFFKADWISNLKIRLSWGINGNRDIGPYDALARLSSTSYLYGNNLAIGVFSSSMANTNLKWERTQATNLGIDFGLFDSRIYGSIDAYNSITTDLLLRRSLPRIIGYTNVMSNMGELQNRGVELTLNSVNVSKPNFSWKSSFIFSHNKNKIIHLYGDMMDVVDEDGNIIGQREADDLTNQWFIGQSIDRIWDYEILGIWQQDEAELAARYGKQPGDMKLRDVNGDFRYNPADDKVFQGYKKPKFRMGLRNDLKFLKNFELSSYIRADLGFYGINNLYQNDAQGGQWERRNTYDVPYWTPDNPNNEWARLASNMTSPSFDVWKNRSFVRLQDVSIGYNVPSEKLQFFRLSNLKMYVNMHNVLTFSSWQHYDPESGTTPMPKTYTLGLNLSL